MAFEDKIFIRTSEDIRFVFQTYLGILDEDVKLVEEQSYLLIEDERWEGIAQPVVDEASIRYAKAIGFKPNMSFSIELPNTETDKVRARLIDTTIRLVQRINCDMAYVCDYWEVVARYTDGQLEIKTNARHWIQDVLASIVLPYNELPELPNL